MRAYLQKVATGPELGKSLDRASARDAMAMILSGDADIVQAAVYLIALRIKRETLDETLGGLDALTDMRALCAVDCAQLLTIAEPFNGMLRAHPPMPFVPAVLAACGLPAYCHGVRTVAPKFGVTAHRVYRSIGIATDLTPSAAAAQLADDSIGWAYLDQSRYLPALYALRGLRARMVKRTCLSTLEVTLAPLRARRTQLLCGYVHRDYPPVYLALARACGYDGASVVRGVEGGCIPSLAQPSKLFCYDADGERKLPLRPAELGIRHNERATAIAAQLAHETPVRVDEYGDVGGDGDVGGKSNSESQSQSQSKSKSKSNISNDALTTPIDVEASAAVCAALGRCALGGRADVDVDDAAVRTMRDAIIYGAAIGLMQCNCADDWRDAAQQARAAIDDGRALARFDAGREVAG